VEASCSTTCLQTHYCAITRVDFSEYRSCLKTAAAALSASSAPRVYISCVSSLFLVVALVLFSAYRNVLPAASWRPPSSPGTVIPLDQRILWLNRLGRLPGVMCIQSESDVWTTHSCMYKWLWNYFFARGCRYVSRCGVTRLNMIFCSDALYILDSIFYVLCSAFRGRVGRQLSNERGFKRI